MWVDMDIIIDRMDFQIPLSAYEGKDFVIWGRRDKISEGDVLNGNHYRVRMKHLQTYFQGLQILHALANTQLLLGFVLVKACTQRSSRAFWLFAGVNSGVFMVRNTDWSRSFLEAWVPFGSFPPNNTYDEAGFILNFFSDPDRKL